MCEEKQILALFGPLRAHLRVSQQLFWVDIYVSSSDPMRNNLDQLNLVVDPAHV